MVADCGQLEGVAQVLGLPSVVGGQERLASFTTCVEFAPFSDAQIMPMWHLVNRCSVQKASSSKGADAQSWSRLRIVILM